MNLQCTLIASRIYGTKQVLYVLPVCLYVAYATLYAGGYVRPKFERTGS